GHEVFAPSHDALDLLAKRNIHWYLTLHPVDAVIHLAAMYGGIGANRERPAEFFYNNLIMGVELLHAAYKTDIQKFVAVGTVCAYPKYTPVPFKEEDLWNGYPEETNAPYGLAKKMLLVQSQAYRAQYGFNSIYLLPVNLYGPHDNFNPDSSHVIPVIIRKISEAIRNEDEQVVLWGSGRASREFLFVEDCARGICDALEKYNGKDPINLGTGKHLTIRELAELIGRLMGYRGNFVWDENQPDGQPTRCLDISRALRHLGWVPQVGLEEGLKRTIGWWRGNG
ncbi:MAG: GDP-L-fucose synthase, partial [Candidatus Omnitrophota bacterium]